LSEAELPRGHIFPRFIQGISPSGHLYREFIPKVVSRGCVGGGVDCGHCGRYSSGLKDVERSDNPEQLSQIHRQEYILPPSPIHKRAEA